LFSSHGIGAIFCQFLDLLFYWCINGLLDRQQCSFCELITFAQFYLFLAIFRGLRFLLGGMYGGIVGFVVKKIATYSG
jgi:hypothetical protein